MDDACLSAKELAAALEQPDETRFRAHLDACAACRALVASYAAFLAGDAIASPEVSAAEEDLRARIGVLTGHPPVASWQPAEVPPRRGRGRLMLGFLGFAVTAGLVLWAILPRQSESPIYRGTSEGLERLEMTATLQTGGDVRLSWTRERSAEAYRIRLLSKNLQPLASFAVAGDTIAVIKADTLAAIARLTAGPLLWDVAPVIGGDVRGPSTPQILPDSPGPP